MPRTLREIMTTDVEVVAFDTTVNQVARLMRDLNVGIIPVVRDEQLQGVITDRDIVLRLVAESRDATVTTAAEIMSRDITIASPEWTIDVAAKVMASEQIRRLPIMDEQRRLVGIVSLGDLAVDSERDSRSGETLEAISRPAQPER